jgi:hypothetical protein
MQEAHQDMPARAAFFRKEIDGTQTLFWPQYFYRSWGDPTNAWGGGSYGAPFPAETSLDDAVRDVFRDTKGAAFFEAKLGAGEFHPRMWRPAPPGQTSGYTKEILETAQVVSLLTKDMCEVFETLEPIPGNRPAHGHRIRQLLLLACMEVESAWSAVLRVNGHPGERWTTRDYVKLLKPMRLDAYSVRLSRYPDWPELRPFRGWDPLRATKSLPWYEAYNESKHNREVNLDKATLGHMIDAVAAAFIMLNSQFGTPVFPGGALKTADFPEFLINCDPASDKEFSYIPDARWRIHIPVPYPFEPPARPAERVCERCGTAIPAP